MTTYAHVQLAIDQLSESVRINGCENRMTEFLINYLSGNIDDIVDDLEEVEELGEDDESNT